MAVDAPSSVLTICLAERLKGLLGQSESREYSEAWREKRTPAGRLYRTHTASRIRKPSSDSCIGWPTPDAQKHTSMGLRDRPSRAATGRTTGYLAEVVAELAGWPTPGMMDGNRAGKEESFDHWEKSKARHAEKGVNKHFHLNAAASSTQSAVGDGDNSIDGWTTPKAGDIKGTNYTRYGKDGIRKGSSHMLQDQVQLTKLETSGSEGVKRDGHRLNPSFSRWLMGFPPEWCGCAATAMEKMKGA